MQAQKGKEPIDDPRSDNPYGILGSSTRDEILDFFGGCRLCWAADEQGQRDPLNRILLETEDFVLLPALGAFVTGYVLLVSKEHRPAVGALSVDEVRSLQGQLEDVFSKLVKSFPSSSWIVFEHGTTIRSGPKACCIDHLHFHLLPMAASLSEEVGKKLSCEAEPVASLESLVHVVGDRWCNYIYLREGENGSYLFRPDRYSSQFLRQLIAARSGRESAWNWMHHPHEDNMLETIAAFKKAAITPRMIYYAHAIEGVEPSEIESHIKAAQECFAENGPSVELISMFDLLDPWFRVNRALRENDSSELLVETEVRYMRACDLVLVDLSRPGWQYVGALMELVYAREMGIPVVAITGDSPIRQRKWLRAHVTEFADGLYGAVEAVKRLL